MGSNLQNTVDNEVFLGPGKGTEGRRQRSEIRGQLSAKEAAGWEETIREIQGKDSFEF